MQSYIYVPIENNNKVAVEITEVEVKAQLNCLLYCSSLLLFLYYIFCLYFYIYYSVCLHILFIFTYIILLFVYIHINVAATSNIEY